MSARPLGVLVLGLLCIAAGVISLALVVFLPRVGALDALPLIVTSGFNLVAGYGLLKGRQWARLLFLWISPIFILAGMFVLDVDRMTLHFVGPKGAPWISYGIGAFYLSRPHVVQFFKGTPRSL